MSAPVGLVAEPAAPSHLRYRIGTREPIRRPAPGDSLEPPQFKYKTLFLI
ncbi:hypothetical protein BEI_0080 [Halomonas beimenensis]|uniref:Uncharacterized protein n=1 Tax=Halomonas beimenensis TaxID=475662 RepID=A0A291P2F2_9GAMM|nr:hypothetical protein BEI_0080 [Halomonas beimenensis]